MTKEELAQLKPGDKLLTQKRPLGLADGLALTFEAVTPCETPSCKEQFGSLVWCKIDDMQAKAPSYPFFIDELILAPAAGQVAA